MCVCVRVCVCVCVCVCEGRVVDANPNLKDHSIPSGVNSLTACSHKSK